MNGLSVPNGCAGEGLDASHAPAASRPGWRMTPRPAAGVTRRMEPSSLEVDVAVIGGSYAGLSASLQLARARRTVAIVDAGVRRNRFAAASHGFLGQDGQAPGAIAEKARGEVRAYPSVRWIDGLAEHAAADDGAFTVGVNGQPPIRARRIVLAPGVVDTLPDIDGLAERWGASVFHCPYCHGYELDRGNIGVVATGTASFHQAMMLPDWGTVTLFTNGAFAPDATERAALSARGVVIEPAVILRVTDRATVWLADGRAVALDGLFTASRTHVATPVPVELGCAFDEGPLGSFIRTDALKATTVAGVFACGDAARGAGSVALAVGDGAQAGMSAHRSLLFGTWTAA